MTFISVIIPFYRGKRYLKDCLDSLNTQNLDDEEIIIIINGNEEEGILDLIESYENLNIIVKVYDNPLGVGKARNIGLENSTGEYVYFIDSDDYIYSDGLKKLLNIAKKTNADFINGERINTFYIRDRFEEELEETTPLKQKKTTNDDFSLKLMVGYNTHHMEILSVLHALIKREVIGNTLFDENNRYFSDYDFIMGIFDNINSFYGVDDAIYAKRQSDDPIKLISLTQEKKDDEVLLYCDEYNKLKKRLSNKLLKKEMLDKFFRFYYEDFAVNFARHPDKKWRTTYFDALREILLEHDLKNMNILKKQELKAFQANNKKKLKSIVQVRFLTKRLYKMATEEGLLKKMIYKNIYNKKPLRQNQIFIECFRGDFYSDSPKYLYQYLLEHYSDKYEFVWVMNHRGIKIPGNPKTVKKFSLGYYKQAALSKYWLINTRQSAVLLKRPDQIMLSTWHGTPLKRLGFDQGNLYLNNPESKFKYKQDSSQWNYLVSPNKFTTERLKSAFAYDGPVLEYGYPRNDILYNYDDELVGQIKERLDLPKNKKIILYAPTWRDDEFFDVGKVKFELKLELDKLKQSIGEEYIVLVRTHYFIANNLDLTNAEGFAFDVSKYEDIAELYLISDMLITDYSSVFFDYANLRRPILFFTYDLDKYENMLRGFYIDIRTEVPGPLLYSTEEVIDAVKNIESINAQYSDKYNEFYDRFCSIDDGNASKRIVEEIWGDKK